MKNASDKATSLPHKPEAVKIELPSFNPARLDRSSVCILPHLHVIGKNLKLSYGHKIVMLYVSILL